MTNVHQLLLAIFAAITSYLTLNHLPVRVLHSVPKCAGYNHSTAASAAAAGVVVAIKKNNKRVLFH